MWWASRAVVAALNNNALINVVLVGSFAALSLRSLNHQNEIATVEAEKESLIKSNESMKKSTWDWKQRLFSESGIVDSAIVPLSRLKSIYGEAPTPQTGDAVKEDPESSFSKFVV